MKIIKAASLPLLFSTLFVTGVLAQGTYTAASCNQSDVNSVINGPMHKAVDGDAIVIPAGSCTWTSGVSVGVGISITGQGTPNGGAATMGAGTSTTTITDNSSTALFNVSGLTYGQTVRIELLNIAPMISSTQPPLMFDGTCTASGCPKLRVDNITYPNGWVGKISGVTFNVVNNFFGVFDHITDNQTAQGLALMQISHSGWLGVGQYGDNSFASADSLGTNQAVYIENNALGYTSGTENDVGYSFAELGGARYVCRYNQFSNGTCNTHGTAWTGRPRGMRQMEYYRNTMSYVGVGDSGVGFNSGVGFVFENIFTGYFNQFVSLDVPRSWGGGGGVWGFCDGSQPWDTNDGTTYDSGTVTTGGQSTFSDSRKSWTTNQWAGIALTNGTPYSAHDVTQNSGQEITSNTAAQITMYSEGDAAFSSGDSYQILRATVCLDQPGRSGGSLYAGSSPSPSAPANQTLDPIYEWGDYQASGGAATVYSKSHRLIANRDYYAETHDQGAQTSPTSPFDGTSGNGHGILDYRPKKCTPNVGYWATDQGDWNHSGSGEQGELFVCTATDTWSLYYTPYVYPHPLDIDPPHRLRTNP